MDDALLITDAHAIPVDKYFRPGEFPGRVHISIGLSGPFLGGFPAPAGASGEGKKIDLKNGVEAREWVYPSPGRDEIGLIRTIVVRAGERIYEVHAGPVGRQEQQTIVDRILASFSARTPARLPTGKVMVKSTERISLPDVGISLNVPTAFIGEDGALYSRRPILPPSENGRVTIRNWDSYEVARSPGPTQYLIQLLPRRRGVSTAMATEKCIGAQKRIKGAAGSWWCKLDPASNIGDNHQTHVASVHTVSGTFSVYVWGLGIGDAAAEAILDSIRTP